MRKGQSGRVRTAIPIRVGFFSLRRNASAVISCVVVALSLSFLVACDQRDPQAEFEALSVAVYTHPKTGFEAAQEYIDHFYAKKESRVAEVTEIRNHYRSMDEFFSNSFRSYADFMTRSRRLNEELSQSSFPGVRNTWKNLYAQERDRLLAPLMGGITDQTFDSFFKAQIRYLCEQQYNTWNYESIDQVSLSTPAVVRDGTAKESSGTYRVHLRGSILGLRTSTATVSIKGLIGIDERGNVFTERTGYDFLDGPLF